MENKQSAELHCFTNGRKLKSTAGLTVSEDTNEDSGLYKGGNRENGWKLYYKLNWN